jgi:23S rRNA (adenine2503-C2)-methyltransferase
VTESPWTPSRSQWAEQLATVPRYRLDQLWHGLYRQGLPPSEITNLPKALRTELADRFRPALQLAAEQRSSDSATIKWLWEAGDGSQVETVLMHYDRRSTVCISSQAGCAMGCRFCATGQAGFTRHLSVGEILEQVAAALRESSGSATGSDGGAGSFDGRRLSNVVFMGMGEPMANYERVLEVTRRLINDFEIGARRITISTVGLVPQMLRLAEEGLQVGLALSLHAANDELRNELVPVNRRHPISDLVAACQLFRERTGRRVSLEWAMIDGVNDRPVDAAELSTVARKARAHVNLIPLNPTPGWPTVGSPAPRIAEFADRLRADGVNVTVRRNRGTDIDAACGQLAGRRPPESTPVHVGPGRG